MNRFPALLLRPCSLFCLLLTGGLLSWLLVCLPVNLRADTITAPLAESTQGEQQDAGEPADIPAGLSASGPVEPLQQNAVNAPPGLQTASAAAELRDIKEPVEIVNNQQKLLITAAAVLTAVILLALLIFWWKRSRKQQAILAHETALQQLEQAGQLIEEQKVNAFITLIDQTLRRYIEQRFAISARRQTTREFITGLTADRRSVPQPLTDNSENLKTWLEHCDLVKFARAGLSRETMREMVANLRLFIESTRLESEQPGTAHKEAEK